MEIKELDYKEIDYEDLNIGDCFMCQMGNTVYMKLSQILDELGIANQAVDLNTGLIVRFKVLAPVIPVDAKLEIRKRYKDSNKDSVIIKERIVRWMPQEKQ